MPPKPKYQKEQIAEAAFKLVRENGIQSLTARELGKALGVSSSPIFTFYNDMEELKKDVYSRAIKLYVEYMALAENFFPAYKKRGLQWIKFASEEPELFKWLFMSAPPQEEFARAAESLQKSSEKDISIIMRDYNATEEQAKRLFNHMYIYSFGLCVMLVTGIHKFTEAELSQMLGEEFSAIVGMLTADKPLLAKNMIPEQITAENAESYKKLSPSFKKDGRI